MLWWGLFRWRADAEGIVWKKTSGCDNKEVKVRNRFGDKYGFEVTVSRMECISLRGGCVWRASEW